jgi:hypothetical protein
MVVKEQDYKRKGNITTFGNKNFNANEAEIVNKYSNTELGKLQDIDSYIRNIYKYINEISDNFYKAIYQEDELNNIYSNLKKSEDLLFFAAKIL